MPLKSGFSDGLGGGSFFKPLIFSALCVAFRSFIILDVVYLMAKIRISEQKAKFYLNFFERECLRRSQWYKKNRIIAKKYPTF